MGKTSLALLTWWKHPLKMRWKEYISDVAEELRSVVLAWMEFWSEARRGNVGEFEFDWTINECFPGNFPIFTLLTFHYNATQPRILTSNFLHWLKAITDSFPSRASQKRWQVYWKLKSIVNRAENPSPYGEWAINYGRRLTLNSKVSPRNCFSHGREPASRGRFFHIRRKTFLSSLSLLFCFPSDRDWMSICGGKNPSERLIDSLLNVEQARTKFRLITNRGNFFRAHTIKRLRQKSASTDWLTDSNPNRDVPSTSQIAHEYDGDHIADFVARRYQPWQTRWNIESLFYCRYDGINVTGAQSLLECYEQRQKKHENLRKTKQKKSLSIKQRSSNGKLQTLILASFWTFAGRHDKIPQSVNESSSTMSSLWSDFSRSIVDDGCRLWHFITVSGATVDVIEVVVTAGLVRVVETVTLCGS